jgi:tetratricopeptide (TPR) repeat protein
MIRGVITSRIGKLDEALQTFDQAVTLDPGFAEAYNQRAMVHTMREEYADAVHDLEWVLSLEPRHFNALVELGQIFEDFDRNEAALQCYEAALRINPHLSAVRDEAAQLKEHLAGTPI